MSKSIIKTPKAIDIKKHLQQNDIEITIENAAEILQILSFLAKLIVKQNFLK